MNHKLPTRSVFVAPAAVLVLACAGCGGGSDAAEAPEDASRADFCKTFLAEPEGFTSDDPEEAADAAHDYADKLREVGTPDVSDDARAGFEIYVDFLTDVEAGDADELEKSGPSDLFDDEELEKFEAFSKVTADCGPGEF